ncbi:hypothetical protein GLE_0926 [Lysobacter enzymogenes]|uniref:Uncharacterized protein n=1 Tax=Lysobacter enzymogenes TaxID=69 RepID=A0A0S2DCP4_LYSEN|nr:hypothetical protein GLE_0926 [Lysobacter enzymogenes]
MLLWQGLQPRCFPFRSPRPDRKASGLKPLPPQRPLPQKPSLVSGAFAGGYGATNRPLRQAATPPAYPSAAQRIDVAPRRPLPPRPANPAATSRQPGGRILTGGRLPRPRRRNDPSRQARRRDQSPSLGSECVVR